MKIFTTLSGPAAALNMINVDTDQIIPKQYLSAINSLTLASSMTISRTPFFTQLLKKISAKPGAMTQRMPKSSSDQGACSRLEPQPKFSPVMRNLALR